MTKPSNRLMSLPVSILYMRNVGKLKSACKSINKQVNDTACSLIGKCIHYVYLLNCRLGLY